MQKNIYKSKSKIKTNDDNRQKSHADMSENEKQEKLKTKENIINFISNTETIY